MNSAPRIIIAHVDSIKNLDRSNEVYGLLKTFLEDQFEIRTRQRLKVEMRNLEVGMFVSSLNATLTRV
jgi:hypothetical protein